MLGYDDCSQTIWGKIHVDLIKSCESSALSSVKNDRHGSTGSYYSFGNKAFYGKIGNSSIDQYKN